jgi:cell division protein FtsB
MFVPYTFPMKRSGSAKVVLLLMALAAVVLLGVGFVLLKRIERLEQKKPVHFDTSELQKELDQAKEERRELRDQIQSLKTGQDTQTRRTDQAEKLQDSQDKRLQKLDASYAKLLDQVKKLETAQPKIVEVAKPDDKQSARLLASLQALREGHAELQARLEAARKADETLSGRVKTVEDGQGRLGKRTDDNETKRKDLALRVRGLEAARLKFETELDGLHSGDRFEELFVRLREIKFKLLLSRYHCSDGASRGEHFFPFQDHFAYLGVDFAYLSGEVSRGLGLKQGEGLRVMQVHERSPAKDLGLKVGDLLMRIDGKPVKPCGLPGECLLQGKWSQRSLLPSYVTRYLPGDTAELEFKRGSAIRKVKVRLMCRVDGDACAFYDYVPGE